MRWKTEKKWLPRRLGVHFSHHKLQNQIPCWEVGVFLPLNSSSVCQFATTFYLPACSCFLSFDDSGFSVAFESPSLVCASPSSFELHFDGNLPLLSFVVEWFVFKCSFCAWLDSFWQLSFVVSEFKSFLFSVVVFCLLAFFFGEGFVTSESESLNSRSAKSSSSLLESICFAEEFVQAREAAIAARNCESSEASTMDS